MPTSIPITDAPSRLQSIFRYEHEHLERDFEKLIEAFRADPRSVGIATWRSFEAGLREHFHIEEDVLFPAFQRAEPDLVATLRREHDAIRKQLDSLAVGVELHSVQADLVAQFVASLRAHAEREDGHLYRRIDTVLTPDERYALCGRILENVPFGESVSA